MFTNKKTIENHIKKFHEATIVVNGVYKQENYRKLYQKVPWTLNWVQRSVHVISSDHLMKTYPLNFFNGQLIYLFLLFLIWNEGSLKIMVVIKTILIFAKKFGLKK